MINESENEELQIVQADAAEDENEVVFHDEPSSNDLTAQKIYIASGVIFSVLFLMAAILVTDAVSQIRQWHYVIPAWFIDICKLTITSAMIVLGLGSLGAIQNYLNRK